MFVETAQVDVILMNSFVERTNRDTTRSREQGKTHVIPAQSDSTCRRLIVFNRQDGNLRFPVGGNQTDVRAIFHDFPGTVCQLMQHGRVGPGKLRFDRIFLEHQVIAVQFHVGVRIMGRKILLNLCHVVDQCIGRSKVDYQFTVR